MAARSNKNKPRKLAKASLSPSAQIEEHHNDCDDSSSGSSNGELTPKQYKEDRNVSNAATTMDLTPLHNTSRPILKQTGSSGLGGCNQSPTPSLRSNVIAYNPMFDNVRSGKNTEVYEDHCYLSKSDQAENSYSSSKPTGTDGLLTQPSDSELVEAASIGNNKIITPFAKGMVKHSSGIPEEVITKEDLFQRVANLEKGYKDMLQRMDEMEANKNQIHSSAMTVSKESGSPKKKVQPKSQYIFSKQQLQHLSQYVHDTLFHTVKKFDKHIVHHKGREYAERCCKLVGIEEKDMDAAAPSIMQELKKITTTARNNQKRNIRTEFFGKCKIVDKIEL